MIIKQIPGYEGRYVATDSGEIYSLISNRILKSHTANHGYHSLMLKDALNRRKGVMVHTLVARAFLGRRPDGMTINHMNGVKTDNRPANLEYCTLADNIRHAKETGLIKSGEAHYRYKFTDLQRCNMEHLQRSGVPMKELASRYECSIACVATSIQHVRISLRIAGETTSR